MISNFLPWAIIGIIFGGRFGYVLIYDLPYFLENLDEIYKIWNGGMSFHGGLIGIIISTLIFSKKYKLNLKRRHEIAKRYIKNLKENNYINFMPYSENCSFFIFQILVKNRDKLITYLKENKIQFSIHYANSLNKMTYYKNKYKK